MLETNKIKTAHRVPAPEQLNLENIKQIPEDEGKLEYILLALTNEVNSLKAEIKEIKSKLSDSTVS